MINSSIVVTKFLDTAKSAVYLCDDGGGDIENVVEHIDNARKQVEGCLIVEEKHFESIRNRKQRAELELVKRKVLLAMIKEDLLKRATVTSHGEVIELNPKLWKALCDTVEGR